MDLDEDVFLDIASLVLSSHQNDLVPSLVRLLENMQTPLAIELLKSYRERIGSPLVRAYCNLALYRLREKGPYEETLIGWIKNEKKTELIKFRPFVPWSIHQQTSQFQLTPEEKSRLLIESFQALAERRENKGIDELLEIIKTGNPKNRYPLAGLLIRATE